MSHQDQDGPKVQFNYQYLRLALDWLLRTTVFSSLTFRQDCTWNAQPLAAAALLWAWSDEATLGERFQTARKIVQHLFALQQEPAGSYQAFTKLLRRWTSRIAAILAVALRQRMQEALAKRWLLHGRVVFGVDGSRVELPRTRSNESAYAPPLVRKKRKRTRRSRQSAAARAKKAHSPQLWLTTLWHAATGLPWDWRIGPCDSSERGHLLEMLAGLPREALVTGDAGFVGYEFLRGIVASGRQLLVRVGGNVRLLQKLGYVRESAGIVYLWPDAAQRRSPPLVLRLVVASDGKHPVYLVTSVLASHELSDRQVCDLYRLRWGIELFYRHLKQTYQRRKLRSARADNARLELEWSLLGLWAMSLYAQVELARQEFPPARSALQACSAPSGVSSATISILPVRPSVSAHKSGRRSSMTIAGEARPAGPTPAANTSLHPDPQTSAQPPATNANWPTQSRPTRKWVNGVGCHWRVASGKFQTPVE